MTLSRSLSLAALLALPPAGASPAAAQDAPSSKKDDALDSLLKKFEDKKPGPAARTEDRKPDDAGPSKIDPGKDAKPKGEVAGKDKEIDSLLEKLGATEDRPSPDDKKPGAGGGEPKPGDTPPPEKPGADGKKSDSLTGKSKELDEHLEELTGKRRKKKPQDDNEGGALSDVIKEMREVQERLGKPDTGEETRKKQTQIVKRIETLIEQARASSSQSRGKPRKGMAMKPGQQPGGQQDQPGSTGGNAPFARPQKPTDRRSLAGGKDTWGHLPPELRQEMDNVFREEFLPSRDELIRRYYQSVNEKKLARGR